MGACAQVSVLAMQGSVNPAAARILAKLTLISGLVSSAVVQVRRVSSPCPAASPMMRHAYCYTVSFCRDCVHALYVMHVCRAQLSFMTRRRASTARRLIAD